MLPKTECTHPKTTDVIVTTGPHKLKKVCESCHKFISWVSTKSEEQRKADRKVHIQNYYKNNPDKDKYAAQNRNTVCLFD
jgi:hypothetical protein